MADGVPVQLENKACRCLSLLQIIVHMIQMLYYIRTTPDVRPGGDD